MRTCKICKTDLAAHTNMDLARCVDEDNRRAILRRLECDISWERERNEQKLAQK